MKSILEVVRDLIKPYIDKNANNIAPVEDSPVENPYYVGDQLIYKGVLYNVSADISIGDTLEIGTNISVAPKINSSVKSVFNKLRSNGSSSGTDFNFDIQNGIAGWNSATTRDAATFHPFSAGSTASDISYTNTTSGLTATNVQNAIDEVDGNVDNAVTNINKKLPTYANGTSYWDTTPTASSTKPVTSGGVKTQIDSINGNKANQTVIATRQANLVASRRYEIGEQFVYDNNLYRATAVIANNDAITIGSSGNAVASSNISTQLYNHTKTLKTGMTGGYTFIKNYVYTLGKLVNISCVVDAPAGVNPGSYLAIAYAPYAPIEEVVGTALIVYGAHTYATAVKIQTDTTIMVLSHSDVAQVAGGNLCDVSFNICYMSNAISN